MHGAITGLYAAITALMAVGLGVRVALLRIRHQVGLGDGGVPELGRAIRVHGNLTEYAPLALLLLLLAELGAALPAGTLHAAGIAIVGGRALHAFGVSRSARRSPGRLIGMLLTWITMAALALALIARLVG